MLLSDLQHKQVKLKSLNSPLATCWLIPRFLIAAQITRLKPNGLSATDSPPEIKSLHQQTIMFEFLNSLQDLLLAIWGVVAALGQLAISHWFLLAWIGYFTFAVPWAKAFDTFSQGGWIAAGLVSSAVIAVLSAVSDTTLLHASVFGWNVNPTVGTLATGITYLAIAFFCGSIQMSGRPAKMLDWIDQHMKNAGSAD